MPTRDQKLASNWGAISPIFRCSADVKKLLYTTNAIQSLNNTIVYTARESFSQAAPLC